MKIQCIADTHGSYFVDKIEDCDILLMAGDISPVQCDHSYTSQRAWFMHDFVNGDLIELQEKAKYIVFIGGNHDTYLSEVNISDGSSRRINEQLPENVWYLCDDLIDIEGIKIYGTPWCVLPKWARQGPPVWNFAKSEDELADIYAGIPEELDILLTHGPAYGTCDVILDQVIHLPEAIKNYQPDHLGSNALTHKIYTLKHKPLYVLSGHIHSAERKVQRKDDVGYACTSILSEEYKFSDEQKPFIFDIAWRMTDE